MQSPTLTDIQELYSVPFCRPFGNPCYFRGERRSAWHKPQIEFERRKSEISVERLVRDSGVGLMRWEQGIAGPIGVSPRERDKFGGTTRMPLDIQVRPRGRGAGSPVRGPCAGSKRVGCGACAARAKSCKPSAGVALGKLRARSWQFAYPARLRQKRSYSSVTEGGGGMLDRKGHVWGEQ
jgi:hypothetical protein